MLRLTQRLLQGVIVFRRDTVGRSARAFGGSIALLTIAVLGYPAAQELPSDWPHPAELSPEELVFSAPEPRHERLSNGISVLLMEDRTLPLVQGVAYVDAPSVYDPEGMKGLASMTASMLREGGAGELTPDELDAALERLAASVEASGNEVLASVAFNSLTETVPDVLPIWRDVLTAPRFDEQRLEVRRQRLIEAIRRVVDNPTQLAFREFFDLVSGDHPSGDYETVESVSAVGIGDIEEFYRQHYGPANTVVAVTGDFESEEMLELLEELLGEWDNRVHSPPELPPHSPPEPRIYLLPREMMQSVIVVGHPAVRAYTPEYNDLDVVNHVLGGGGFTSRLFEEIRTRRGLAYSTGSVLTQGFDWPGTFIAYSISPGEATGQVLELLIAEIRRMHAEGVSAEELERARQTLLNSSLFRFASPAAVNERTARVRLLGLEAGYYDRYLENLQSITVEEVQDVVAQEIDPDGLVVLVVGDPSRFDAPLETFGEVVTIGTD